MITRAVLFRNDADGPLTLNKAASACLDLPFGSWDLIHFQGRHCMERQKERMPLPPRCDHPALCPGCQQPSPQPPLPSWPPLDAGEEAGECLGAMLVYSGNFKIECEVSQMGSTRLVAGISDENFSWTLAPGESFTARKCCSATRPPGWGDLSHQYHLFLQEHVIRSRWKDRPRPVLLNNWEATYMDFDAERLYRIARQARELGVELFVLDDGWFGHRVDDKGGLGDWQINEAKLGCTLPELIHRIHALGMLFGLWV